MKKCFWAVLLASLCAIFTVGCSFEQPPPIAVTFRGSGMDFGTTWVMRIKNCSKDKMLEVRVNVQRSSPSEVDQETSHSVRINPGHIVELGRLEMGWAFKKGDFFWIKAEGYRDPVKGYVP